MNRRLRVPVMPLVAHDADLDAATARYVARVRRLGVGDQFVAFDPVARTEADAIVLAVTAAGGVRCRFGEQRAARLVAVGDVWLLQAVGKGDKVDQVIRDATVLGATGIWLASTQRTVVRIRDTTQRAARWQTIAVQAARQSGRGDVPEIRGPDSLEKVLGHRSESAACRICLDPGGEHPLGQLVSAWQSATPLLILIGPEGGLTRGEVVAAERRGFVSATLGPFTLRTETAATAVLGAVAARLSTVNPGW